MRKNPQYSYRTTALNSKYFAARFEVETNWFVLTGAACAGKTTLINQLAEEGYATVPEVARIYFESEMSRGVTPEMLLEDGLSLQRSIATLQLKEEGGIDPKQLVFLDRGTPDSVTFIRIFGYDPNRLVPMCFQYRYAAVFVLDRLPLQRENTLGPEDQKSSEFLDEWLAHDYRALGYDVIRVPPVAPKERLAFVLDKVAELGLEKD